MIATLLVATTLGQACYAGGYNRGYGYGYNYGYKQTYNYGYNNGYVDRLLFVPLAPAYSQAVVTTAAQTTTASTPAPNDDRIDRLEASVSKLADAVATLASRPAQAPVPPPTQPAAPAPIADDGPIMAGRRRRPTPPPACVPAPPPAPIPAATNAAPYTVSLRPETAAALATNCAKCHTGETAKGQLRIFSAPGTFAGLDLDGLAAMAEATESGRMPKHAPISEADKAAIVSGLREILAASGQQ